MAHYRAAGHWLTGLMRYLDSEDHLAGVLADDYSVRYLSTSGYACDGTAGFFTKLLAEGQDVNIPEFLSDHPASEARVEAIQAAAASAGCSTELSDRTNWHAVQAKLPPLTDGGQPGK